MMWLQRIIACLILASTLPPCLLTPSGFTHQRSGLSEGYVYHYGGGSKDNRIDQLGDRSTDVEYSSSKDVEYGGSSAVEYAKPANGRQHGQLKGQNKNARQPNLQPIQLIAPLPNHMGFEIIPSSLELIAKIPKPIAVIAAIGSFHVGKSLFLNLLNEQINSNHHFDHQSDHHLDHLDDKIERENHQKGLPQGFPIANSPHPTTQGVWTWNMPLTITYDRFKRFCLKFSAEAKEFSPGNILLTKYVTLLNNSISGYLSEIGAGSKPRLEKINVIFLDTEGFNSPLSTRKYDEALFALVATLSSELMYFTRDVLDSRDLLDIEELVRTTNSSLIRIYSESGRQGVAKVENEEVGEKVVKDGNEVGKKVDNVENEEVGKDGQPVSEEFGVLAHLLDSVGEKNLTVVVQNYQYQLDGQRGLEWLQKLLNSHRHDLSISELSAHLEHEKCTFDELLKFFAVDGTGEKLELEIETLASRYTQSLSTCYKYSVHNLFSSVDALFLPRLGGADGVDLDQLDWGKPDLHHTHISDECGKRLREFKIRMFGRALAHPLTRSGLGKSVMVSGSDFALLTKFMVEAVNAALKNEERDFGREIAITKLQFYKSDLLSIYESEISKFLSGSIPLQQDLEIFSQALAKRVNGMLAMLVKAQLTESEASQILTQATADIDTIHSSSIRKLAKLQEAHCLTRIEEVRGRLNLELSKLALPMEPKELEKLIDFKVKVAISQVRRSLESDGLGKACKVCNQKVCAFKGSLEKEKGELIAKNTNVLLTLFNNSIEAAINNFRENSDASKLQNFNLEFTQFRQLLSGWLDEAAREFDLRVRIFKRVDDIYTKFHNQLMKVLALLEGEATKHWSEVCYKVASLAIERCYLNFETEAMKLVKLPVANEVVEAVYGHMLLQGLEDLQRVYCSNSPFFEPILTEFYGKMARRLEEMRMKNWESASEPFEEFRDDLNSLINESHLWYKFSRDARERLKPKYGEVRRVVMANSDLGLLRDRLELDSIKIPTNAPLVQLKQLIALKEGRLVLDEASVKVLWNESVRYWLEAAFYDKYRGIRRGFVLVGTKVLSLSMLCVMGIILPKHRLRIALFGSIVAASLVPQDKMIDGLERMVRLSSRSIFRLLGSLLNYVGGVGSFCIGAGLVIVFLVLRLRS